MINVTKTFLPSIETYNNYLRRAWSNNWITNRGILTLELEEKLKMSLNVKNIILTNNGTIPLQIALKLLGKKGEIITTPFSYIATTASIVWENCTPIFIDIHPEYLTIDENKIEQRISKKTTAILATHVFGNPCHIEKIEQIAKKHNLFVIYDAAHCFGVKYNNESIFNYGNVSTCSFHATKIFHTGEGGAMFCNDNDLYKKLYYSHNFGHNGPEAFYGLGINAKISELQAAMGLSIYEHLDEIFIERKKIVNFYNKNLSFINYKTIKIRKNTDWNYSYYPIIFKSETELLKVQKNLNDENIFPRRYFYPSLNTINYVENVEMPISELIASCILCLPLYTGLKTSDLEKITTIINTSIC